MVRVRESGLTSDELRRAKSQIRGNMILGMESSTSRMTRLAVNEIQLGRQVPIDEIAERIEAVGEREIFEVAELFFGTQDPLVSLLGNVEATTVPDGALRLV